LFFILLSTSPISPLFPYTTLFRSIDARRSDAAHSVSAGARAAAGHDEGGHDFALVGRYIVDPWLFHYYSDAPVIDLDVPAEAARSEEHTSELQSRSDLVCRLLLEK